MVQVPIIADYLRSKELLLRWMELSAFSDALYRTHLGTLINQSAQFYTDNDTFAAFAVFATVHRSLGSYRVRLMANASATGLPLVRHMWLQYPSDPNTFGLTAQVLLRGAVRGGCAAVGLLRQLRTALPHGWPHRSLCCWGRSP
jgi:hypothetical protein